MGVAETFNRTFVELKSQHTTPRMRSINTFNRTFVELKSAPGGVVSVNGETFNRTFVELKSGLLAAAYYVQ